MKLILARPSFLPPSLRVGHFTRGNAHPFDITLQSRRRPGTTLSVRQLSFFTGYIEAAKALLLKKRVPPTHIQSAPQDMAKSHLPNVTKEKKMTQQTLRPGGGVAQVQQMLGLITGLKANLQDAVFVSIDCEAFEHAQRMITEVGVAVLDTRDIDSTEAGEDGQAWIEKIQYAHYRPTQYANLRNKNFIKGCPEGFNFGSTTWIDRDDAPQILKNIFRFPDQLAKAGDLSTQLSGPARHIVYVAHNASSDTAYLKQLGFDLAADADVAMTIDTENMASGSKKKNVALHRLLLSLGMEPVNLHNAGNDAAYTLHSLVKMAVKDDAAPGNVARDLLRHGGKLPPLKYNPVVAPQVWAGTAVRPEGELPSSVRNLKSATAVQTKVERKERKRAARAARSAPAAEGEAVQQRPLPSIPGHTVSW